MQKLAIIPFSLTLLRIAALPLFSYLYSFASTSIVLFLFIIIGATDLLDGYLARRLKVNSETGAFFDAAADFILILGMFLLFTDAGLYPLWLSGLIIFAFAQFILSSLLSKKLYDPVGKYYGSFLYIAVALTMAFPIQAVCSTIMIFFTIFTAISITSRIAHLLGFYA
jgi:CDP-diacylglycerol--glycerol-3-phosphate 3-phosphatidyltransferase